MPGPDAPPSVTATRLLRRYGTVLAALLIILVFSVLSPSAFFSVENVINVSRQISFLVIVALAATVVMVVGEFDLSVGAVASLGAWLRRHWRCGAFRSKCVSPWPPGPED